MDFKSIVWIVVTIAGIIIIWRGSIRLENQKTLSGFFMVIGGLALAITSGIITEIVMSFIPNIDIKMPELPVLPDWLKNIVGGK